jgi:ATP-binding cassette, subfamily G (WHITE), member 2, SNQ2
MIITFGLFCGVVIPRPLMPAFWRVWLNPLDPMARLIAGMMSTELHDLRIQCAPNEFSIFHPPTNQTCYEYAATYLESAIGYIANPNATSDCEYCQFKVGDGYLSTLEFSWSARWMELGIFAAFIGSNLIILALAARFLNYAKR